MSPSGQLGSTHHILVSLTAPCGVCGTATEDPTLCTGCGKYGHATCLRLEFFQGYPFCSQCIPQAIHAYSQQADTLRREDWSKSLASQLSSWKALATNVLGASASVGVTVGAAAATSTAAAIALVQGVVQGAQQASPTTPPLEHCVACHTANRSHKEHLRRGDCVGFPGSSYYGRNGNPESAQGSRRRSSSQPPSSSNRTVFCLPPPLPHPTATPTPPPPPLPSPQDNAVPIASQDDQQRGHPEAIAPSSPRNPISHPRDDAVPSASAVLPASLPSPSQVNDPPPPTAPQQATEQQHSTSAP